MLAQTIQTIADRDFPSLEDVARDYNKLLEIVKDIRTVARARELEKYGFEVEINGVLAAEYTGRDEDIKFIRYDAYGYLSYIYDRFDGKPTFSVYSNWLDTEYIYDITIDSLTAERLEAAKVEALKCKHMRDDRICLIGASSSGVCPAHFSENDSHSYIPNCSYYEH